MAEGGKEGGTEGGGRGREGDSEQRFADGSELPVTFAAVCGLWSRRLLLTLHRSSFEEAAPTRGAFPASDGEKEVSLWRPRGGLITGQVWVERRSFKVNILQLLATVGLCSHEQV